MAVGQEKPGRIPLALEHIDQVDVDHAHVAEIPFEYPRQVREPLRLLVQHGILRNDESCVLRGYRIRQSANKRSGDPAALPGSVPVEINHVGHAARVQQRVENGAFRWHSRPEVALEEIETRLRESLGAAESLEHPLDILGDEYEQNDFGFEDVAVLVI